jgi:hypothetical protein
VGGAVLAAFEDLDELRARCQQLAHLLAPDVPDHPHDHRSSRRDNAAFTPASLPFF